MDIKYDENYRKLIISQIEKLKGDMSLRQFAKQRDCDPALLSKILNGKYIPSEKYLLKRFPDLDMPKLKGNKLVMNNIVVKCKELNEVKTILNSLGYDITYIITKCEKEKCDDNTGNDSL